MIAPLLQNAALLVLSGPAIYAILTRHGSLPLPNTGRALLGVALGLVGFLVTISPIIGPSDAALDARAGPTLIASFLGGPIGGFAAASMGAFARFLVGGTFAFSGVVVYFVYAAIGLALGHLAKESREPWISARSAALLCLGSLAGAALMFFIIAPREMALSWLMEDYPLIAFANLLSVLFLTLVCRFAIRRAKESQELKSTVERLELATNAAKTGIWEYDLITHDASWNARMHEIYETSPDDFRGDFEHWIANVHPDDRQSVTESFESMIKDGRSTISEFRAVMADGRIKTISAHAHLLRSRDGKPTRLIGANQDISDLRDSESREQSANRRYLAIAQNVPGAVFQLVVTGDGESRFDYLGDDFRTLCGVPVPEVRADPDLFWDFAVGDQRLKLQTTMTVSQKTMSPWVCRWKAKSRAGELKWFEVRAVPECRDDGGTVWNGILFNVTDEELERQAKAEENEKAFQSQRMEALGKLTGGIAHDFNNLLAIIVGNAEFIRDELTNKEQVEFANAILGASARSAELIQKMLSFARQARLEPEMFNLSEKAKEVCDWIGRTLPATIELETRLSKNIGSVRADAASVETSILNLILNSRDALPGGGKIIVETNEVFLSASSDVRHELDLEPGRYSVLSVHDEGEGIHPDNLDAVFEPFFSTKKPGMDKGSGLGLSMVHGFLKQSGGSVQITSDLGSGTTVALYFPVASVTRIRSDEFASNAISSTSDCLRVIVAEDEPGVARILRRTLTDAGHSVVVGHSGDEAARLFSEHGPFDLLVTDIVMPGKLQGPALAVRLRTSDPRLPAIFISGYAKDANADDIRAEDIRLMKPVTRETLLRAVHDAMQTRQTLDSDVS